jgi:hypothetical protein
LLHDKAIENFLRFWTPVIVSMGLSTGLPAFSWLARYHPALLLAMLGPGTAGLRRLTV